MSDGKKLYWVEESGYVREIKEPFFAIGSGADFAVGAMAAGADPVQAVKIAMKFDLGTGGRVMQLKAGVR